MKNNFFLDMKIVTILLVVFLLVRQSDAQPTVMDPAPNMHKMSFMTGEWQGEGWSMTRAGKNLSHITEKVECKLGCNLLVVSGLGTKTDSTTNEVSIVHEAFGVITYDKAADKHMIRAYKNEDVVVTDIVFLEEKLFQWSIPAPGGTVRFTVDFRQPDTWKEFGEYSQDGATWWKSMEMELRKVKN